MDSQALQKIGNFPIALIRDVADRLGVGGIELG
jgi:hypothetical protein